VELPGGLLRSGYRHGAAPALNRPLLLLGWLILICFAEAVAAEQEDLGVLNQPVGDSSGDGGVVEDVAPLGEGCVGCDDR
jgi:hypothetical protein